MGEIRGTAYPSPWIGAGLIDTCFAVYFLVANGHSWRS